MKAIVIYCSKSGKTEALAKQIQEDVEGDILKIEPAKEYGSFIAACLRAGKERKKRVIVDVKNEIPDLSSYDTVFLGYPIWMSTMPGFFRDFIKKCDFTGKTLFPFCTSKSTSVLSSINDVKESCRACNIKEGLAFRYAKDDTKYKEWIAKVLEVYK